MSDDTSEHDRRLSVTCNDCGFTTATTFRQGDAVAAVLLADQAHDLVWPTCPQAISREAAS